MASIAVLFRAIFPSLDPFTVEFAKTSGVNKMSIKLSANCFRLPDFSVAVASASLSALICKWGSPTKTV